MVMLSACIIAKNEQENIYRCLFSVKDYVDEIVVVDTGSSDNTVEIAQNLGARILDYPWTNDFAAARNFALDHAMGDWIIFLDADEYFEPGKTAHLPDLIKKIHGNRKIDAVCILMKHMEKPDGPVIAHTQSVRLFRHSSAIRYKGRVHEAIFKHSRSPRVIYAPASLLALHHTGYSSASLPLKAKRNLPLLEQDVAENNINCLTYYYLSQSHILLHQYEQASFYALKAMENEEILASTVHHKPYIFYIKSMIFLNAYEQEMVPTIVEAALKKYPFHPEIIHCAGIYHLKLGNYSQALDYLLHALAANEIYNSTLDNEFLKSRGQIHEEIAKLYDKMNASVKCLDFTISALKIDKFLSSAFSFLLSQVGNQKPVEIVHFLDQLYDTKNKADLDFLVRNLAIANQKQLFAHYLKLLSTQFQDNYFIGMKFLICNKFELAFQCFATLFHHSRPDGAELFAVITCLLNNSPNWLVHLYQQTEPPLRKIATAYFQPEKMVSLSEADFPSYSTLVLNFIRLASEEQLVRLLQISFRFPMAEAPIKTLDHMLKNHSYRTTFRLCTEHLQQPSAPTELRSKLFFLAGFCCYKAKDYNRAADFFACALEYAHSQHSAVELLAWSHEQCKSPSIKQKIDSIQCKKNPLAVKPAG
ncbi:MAG: glycosyltransferase [Negativicutes bacterium]